MVIDSNNSKLATTMGRVYLENDQAYSIFSRIGQPNPGQTGRGLLTLKCVKSHAFRPRTHSIKWDTFELPLGSLITEGVVTVVLNVRNRRIYSKTVCKALCWKTRTRFEFETFHFFNAIDSNDKGYTSKADCLRKNALNFTSCNTSSSFQSNTFPLPQSEEII